MRAEFFLRDVDSIINTTIFDLFQSKNPLHLYSLQTLIYVIIDILNINQITTYENKQEI